jgi:predicted peptidase
MKPRILICFLILIGFVARSGSAQPAQTIEPNQQEKDFYRMVAKTFSGKYLLYLPDNYTEQPNHKWPVLLYLHSVDARSQDLEKSSKKVFLSSCGRGPNFPLSSLPLYVHQASGGTAAGQSRI